MYNFLVWITSVDKWTSTIIAKLFFLCWLNVYITAKYFSQIRCSSISSSKLSSSNCIWKIQFKDLWTSAIFNGSLALQRGECRSYRTIKSNFNCKKDTDIHQEFYIFNKTSLSFLNNYILHETIIRDYKDEITKIL